MEMDDTWKDVARRCGVEFIGTTCLAFLVGMTSEAGPLAPLVPGLTLMAMVFAGGHISLASYNPAVTLALTLRPGLLSWISLACYVVTELVGGVCGGLLAWGFDGNVVPGEGLSATLVQIFFAEFIGTFVLTTVVLNAATSADYEGNSFFGIAIGGVLSAMALVLGPTSGAVFNPAVGMLSLLAPVHGGTSVPACAWVYFVAPPIAAALAALVFRLVSPKDHAPRDALMRGPVDNPEHGGRTRSRSRRPDSYETTPFAAN
eukprot:TRINITY_DN4486_c0_g1_i1.p1 TRINITY_DN4486_c0_g1~~TRINITY_DN4486_c0_g1_i1.p1  ORF type:complete len:282 (-),score=75.11 TRINITY_DN4486_c0_g1_i1:195-974(-)